MELLRLDFLTNYCQGVPAGNNLTDTILFDKTPNNLNGILNNFALTGPMSNWVNSPIPVAVSDLSEYNISIYPNPTNEILNAEFGDNVQKITILDITGKQMFEKTNINRNEKINLSDFKPGVYLINIQTDNQVLSTKIVKE